MALKESNKSRIKTKQPFIEGTIDHIRITKGAAVYPKAKSSLSPIVIGLGIAIMVIVIALLV